MDATLTLPPRLAPLAALGAPDRHRDHRYVTELGLTADDVPALLELVKLWTDEEHFERTKNTPATWVHYHACRALAELRAEVVVPTVLAMLDTLDDQEDDLYIGLVPEICGHLGASVLDPLERFLADPEHAQFPRMTVTDALEAIAIAEPQTRARVVAVLVAALARHEELPSLNGGLVAGLVALRAVEHAETIERAFVAGLVERSYCGDWPEVAFQLGVGPQPPGYGPFGESSLQPLAQPAAPPANRINRAKKTDKQARKRQKDARKKSRRK